MDSIIYDYPSKDKDSKIESLSMEGVYIYPLKYSTTLSLVEKEEIAKIHENYVDKFIDISTYAHKFNKYIYNTERVYLNAYRYNSSLINNDIEKESRFIISKSFEKNPFPDFFGKYEYKFIDKKTNTLLATAFKISFLTNFNKFRNKYLYWSQEKEEEFNPPAVQNFDNIYKKLFIDSK
ncbi:MAG: hypothetical protein RBR65_09705 [Aliarcobacter sp.]|nr:hypothetical protein [Aliarcobacter sp.]